MNNLGEIIKAKRLLLGISMRGLARESGISPSELSRIEKGVRKNPSIKVINGIAGALCVSTAELLKAAGLSEGKSSCGACKCKGKNKKNVVNENRRDALEAIERLMADTLLTKDDYREIVAYTEVLLEHLKKKKLATK